MVSFSVWVKNEVLTRPLSLFSSLFCSSITGHPAVPVIPEAPSASCAPFPDISMVEHPCFHASVGLWALLCLPFSAVRDSPTPLLSFSRPLFLFSRNRETYPPFRNSLLIHAASRLAPSLLFKLPKSSPFISYQQRTLSLSRKAPVVCTHFITFVEWMHLNLAAWEHSPSIPKCPLGKWKLFVLMFQALSWGRRLRLSRGNWTLFVKPVPYMPPAWPFPSLTHLSLESCLAALMLVLVSALD